ncbi:EAL domain-containing protein [Paucibacter sp. B51]|uniref:EAL domain-containing protein n=1 Tax=Paucibacter sp. B51 TaxID=2993315 RepID=UPI0022EC07BA|nr:EAL domain-containing protein [Paucibacter sp. B51]
MSQMLPPSVETERLAALLALEVLDSEPEAEFDALVQAAALACDAPVARLALVDARRVWFKAGVGCSEVKSLPRELTCCDSAIQGTDLFEVPDAALDARFSARPLVRGGAGQPGLRFYAGMPLRLRDGQAVGTLCVLDHVPRRLTASQAGVLRQLAQAAALALQGRRAELDAQRMARELAAREAWLRTLSESSPLGIFATDAEGECTYTNPRWQAIYGLSHAQSLGRGWPATLHPDDAGRVLAEWQRCAALRSEFDQQFRLRRPDRSERHVHSRARPVLGPQQQVLGFVGTVEDVSEQVQMQARLRASEERLSVAADSGQIGIWEWDLGSGEMHWDSWMYRLYGLTPPAPGLGARSPASAYELWSRHVHPQDLAASHQAMLQAIDSGQPFLTEFRVVWPDGSTHHLRASGRVIRDEQGRALRLVGSNWDLTEMRRLAAELAEQLAAELAEQHELLRVTLRSIGDAVITTDARGQVRWLNPAAERMSGWPAASAAGRPLEQVFHVVHETSGETLENPVARCLATGRPAGLASQALLLTPDGRRLGVEDSAAPIRNERGELLGAVLVFHDVTEQRRLAGEMSFRASHDPLTGLFNRSEFESRLRGLLERMAAEGVPEEVPEDGAQSTPARHALLYIDLDQFKAVNDACGHAVGDVLLQQVARLLAGVVRGHDTLARLGGDEFALLLEHCPPAQAERVARQICERMEAFQFSHDGRRFPIGASIGLLPLDGRWHHLELALQAADGACYAAKQAGRNRVQVWQDSPAHRATRSAEQQWQARIARALREGRFVLHGQRIEALAGPAHSAHPAEAGKAGETGVGQAWRRSLRGQRTALAPGALRAEVLLRMREEAPTGSGQAEAAATAAAAAPGLVLPAAFLPAAARFQMAAQIDRWVLAEVVQCLQARLPRQVGLLSLNLSEQAIGDRAFHRWALDLLRAAGPEVCAQLCFEISEHTALAGLADAALFLEQVRALGASAALDEFGAGASSFGYLKSLPLDYLKIAGQFVRDLAEDPLDEAAVRAFVDVAQVVGLRTVAGCVDSEAAQARLGRLGVDFSQGFLLHRPVALEQLLPPGAGG